MNEKINASLRDSKVARWSALLLLASTMFFAYMFIDVLAPLSTMLEQNLKWTPDTFGSVAGSEYFLNVFVFFLIFAGIILDKMGVRFTAVLSALVMVAGASIKLYGISDGFNNGGFGYDFLNSFWPAFPASAKMASVGFAIFGCGVEMAGVTVSKGIVKWFKGKEMAMAMGIEMAIARLGVFAVFRLSPILAEKGGISMSVGVGTLLLLIGLLSFSVYFFMDRALERQDASAPKNSSNTCDGSLRLPISIPLEQLTNNRPASPPTLRRSHTERTACAGTTLTTTLVPSTQASKSSANSTDSCTWSPGSFACDRSRRNAAKATLAGSQTRTSWPLRASRSASVTPHAPAPRTPIRSLIPASALPSIDRLVPAGSAFHLRRGVPRISAHALP